MKGYREFFFFSICITLLYLLPSNIFAQNTSLEGQVIIYQEFKSDYPVPENEVARLILTRQGGIYKDEDVSRSVERLKSTELFSDVNVTKEIHEKGVNLYYVLKKKRIIKDYLFSGNVHLLKKEILKAANLKTEIEFRDEMVGEQIEGIINYYKDEGYFKTEATHKIIVDSKTGNVIINFIIKEGIPAFIEDFRITGNKKIPDEEMYRQIKSRKGSLYKKKILNKDLEALENFYIEKGFLGVSIKNKEIWIDQSKVIAEISIIEGRETAINVIGNKAIKAREVKKNITFYEERFFDEYEVEASVEAIKNFYKNNGFPFIDVKYKIEKGEEADQVDFIIEEGPFMKIGKIIIEGNKSISKRRIRYAMRVREKEDIIKDVPFVEEDVQDDMKRVIFLYGKYGFMKVYIEEPFFRFNYSENNVDIIVKIVEGVRTIVKNISITGNQNLSTESILQKLKIKKDYYFDEEAWSNDKFAILDYYAENGYIYAEVAPELKFSEDYQAVDIFYSIKEGKRAFFGSAIILGNEKTLNRVIRREIPLSKNDPYNYQAIIDAQRNIYKLGLFKSARLTPLEAEKQPEDVDVLLKVEEKKAGFVGFGLGYSSEERFRGFFEMGYRNLWGTARTISTKFRLSEISSRYELLYTEPWVLKMKVQGEANLYNETKEEVGYDIRRTGISYTLKKEFTDKFNVSLQYKFEDVKLSNVTTTIESLENLGVRTTSSISPVASYDTRDDIIDPTSGAFYSLSAKLAGGILLGDDEFTKYEAQGSWYVTPIERITLAFSLRGGIVRSYGKNTKVPIYERFFAGGANSVRGYKEKYLGPKDSEGNPIGGEALIIGNIELRFHVVQKLWSVLFLDAGNVWENYRGLRPDNLKSSVGAGIRFKTPVGPIRVDYGYKLRREKGEAGWRIHFNLGYPF